MSEAATAQRRVVGVIQARMGSTRLPGKVLKDIAGQTMLDRVVRRLGRSERLDEVVVATSTLPEDDPLLEQAEHLSVEVVRGDALDVLSRYVVAAEQTAADVVVRVTSDCPFIDPELVTAVIGALVDADGHVDYASNTLEPQTFPRGLDVEVLRTQALLEADRLDQNPATREHVTPFIRDSGRYRLARVANDEDLSALRWTVDTDEDLALARQMAAHFEGSDTMSWRDLLEAWREHPSWHSLNAHVEQKKVRWTGQ